jgi:hypothetical protein
VKVTWTNNNPRPLTDATFFESVVPFGGTGSCPASSVYWTSDAGVTAADPTEAAFADQCGFTITAPTIDAGSSVSATYTLPTEGVDDDRRQGAAQATLAAVAKANGAALDKLTNSWDYPLQRFDALRVVVGQVVANGKVPLTIRPVWSHGAGGEGQAVYDSQNPSAVSPLTTALGQDLSISVSNCAGVRMVGARAGQIGYPQAGGAESGCVITARLGSTEATSSPFNVLTHTGSL